MAGFEQLFVALGVILSSAGIWKYAESKMKIKAEQRKNEIENSDTIQYRDDLKKRVSDLEKSLLESARKEDELNAKILKLTEEVSALRIKVDYLEKENERLKNK